MWITDSQGSHTAQRACAVGGGAFGEATGAAGVSLLSLIPLPLLWLLLGWDTSPQELKVVKGMTHDQGLGKWTLTLPNKPWHSLAKHGAGKLEWGQGQRQAGI